MGEILRIFPTQLKAEEVLRRSLMERESGVLLTGNIYSITEFENRLLDEIAPMNAIGEVERWLLLHDALSNDSAFRRNAALRSLFGAEGFVRAVGDLVQQIKLGLVKSEELGRISGFAPGKEEWIKRVFRRYCASIKKLGLADGADARISLIEKLSLRKSPPRLVARFDEIHFFDIYHFTPFRFELIYLLGRHTKTVVHFPLPDDRRKVFDFVERDIQKFQALEDSGGRIELAFEKEGTGEDGQRTAAPLARFAASIFDDGFDDEKTGASADGLEINKETGAEIIENSSRYREIEEAAQRIIEWKSGRKWSDFCLVFRDLENYGAIVEDVFRRAKIPIYIRRGIPARFNPFVKTLLTVFEAIETNYERDEIVKLACSQYFSFLPGPVKAFEFERTLMDAGITNGPSAAWKKRLDLLKEKAKEKNKGKTKKNPGMAQALKKTVKLVKALEKLQRSSRAKTCLDAFNEAVKLLAPKKMAAGQPFAVRDLWCMERFLRVLAEIENSFKSFKMDKAPFGWSDLRRLIMNSLGNVQPSEWSDRNNVYILNINELAGRRFPFVFVCGLHDGEFPRRAKRGSILTESEKKKFNRLHAEEALAETPHKQRGRAVFSRLGESWEEESFLFYTAARSAVRKFVMIYSTHDLGGGELLHSPFIEDVRAAWPQLEIQRTAPVGIEEDYKNQIDAAARKAKLIRDLFRLPPENAGQVRDFFAYYASTDASFIIMCEKSKIELARLGFYLEFDPDKRKAASTPYTGKVNGKNAALAAYFKNEVKRTYSPTALEKYSACPFRFFMDRPLGCAPMQVPRPHIERTVEGNLMHEILQSYYKKGKAVAGKPLHPALARKSARMKKIKERARKVFEKYEKKGNAGEPGLWEITKRQVSNFLELFIDDEEKLFSETPFTVIETEMEFGADKNPLTIKIGGEAIKLRGFIDRVDYLPGSRLLRVIDYKHTANLSKYSRLLNPELFCTESFQMPVYAFAALTKSNVKSASAGPATPAGAFGAYYAVKKEPKLSNRKPSVFDNVESGEKLAEIAGAHDFGQRILEMVKRMESGDFSVTPRDCIFCKYRPACRYREVRDIKLAE